MVAALVLRPATTPPDVRKNPRRRLPEPVGAAPQVHPDQPGDSYRVCGKPRSTLLVAGSGQREVTTLPRV
jgi:hypothetical protein